jgi:hypothetical protein
MPPWGEAVAELRPEQALAGRALELAEAGALKQLIARMVKRN